MTVQVDESLDGIDWEQAKADLTADDFDNGLGYAHQPVFMSAVVGDWLGNEANRD